MQRYTDYDNDLQDVVRRLAALAEASAAEQQHDAKMVTVATNAAAMVREVLESNVRRARLYGWLIGGAGLSVALIVAVITLSMLRGARDKQAAYDRALARSTATASVLRAQLKANQDQLETTRADRTESRLALTTTLEKFVQTYDRLIEASRELTSARTQNQDAVRGHAVAAKSRAKIASVEQNVAGGRDGRVDIGTREKRVSRMASSVLRANGRPTAQPMSATSQRLVDAMRSQRREARRPVAGLFEVYSNSSGFCVPEP